jgi:hypothetical protein
MIFTPNGFIHGGKCHRPWHHSGKHSLLNVACKIQREVVPDPRIVNMNKRSRCVVRCITHHDGIPMWNEPSPQQGLTSCIFKRYPVRISAFVWSVRAGIGDGSSLTDILYVNPVTGGCIFLGHQH